MTQGKTIIIVLLTLVIGFGAGFVLRPVIVPADDTARIAGVAAAIPAAPHGTQYFAAHVNEARQIVAQCAEGSVRGDEWQTLRASR